MKRKKAVITVELVEESVEETDRTISNDLLNWFKEDAIAAPWVKDVKSVSVKTD